MANGRTKFLVLGLAAATIYGTWSLASSLMGDDPETDSTRYAVNHVWLERLPDNQRDMIAHLALVEHPQGKVGIAGRSSNWRHFIEAYLWKLEGQRLSLYFPQDEVRAHVTLKTYDCKGEAPHPFEICMDIQAGERKATYYSRRDWKIEPHDVEDSLETLAETNPAIARSIAAELHGEVAVLELDPDAVDWPEVAAFPFK